MAIRSMTGFGRAEVASGSRLWVVEVRSVNNRYLDIKLKVPRGYASLEENIRQLVASSNVRGRIDLSLVVNGDFADLQQVRVNLPLARAYRDALQTLAEEFSCANPLSAQLLATYPEVLIREQCDDDLDQIWPTVAQAVTAALAACAAMRAQEGGVLEADLGARLAFFSETIDGIEVMVPELVLQRRRSLQDRLEKLLGTVQLDEARLAQEVAMIADRTDVTEEIVRLRSHIQQFGQVLQESGGVGRKLDFLIQEFLREVNTLASKITDAAVAHFTVDLKSELEKMREQVQNIE